MAYVLGYIYADGHIIDSPYMRGKYLNITSIDKDSILRMKRLLNSDHKIKETRSNFIGSKLCYILRIGSHKICNRLYNLGVHPRKSLEISLPQIPAKYFWHFIRGYFDGDGCVNIERKIKSSGEIGMKRMRIIFTSGSKNFLHKINEVIKRTNNTNGKIYKSKRSVQLIYNTKDSVEIFKLMYKGAEIDSFFIRKFKIFEKYFQLRPNKKDAIIGKIIKHHSYGHVVK